MKNYTIDGYLKYFELHKKLNRNAVNFVIFIFKEVVWNLVHQIEHILILWSKRLYVFSNNFWADNIDYRTGNPFGKSIIKKVNYC